MTDLSIAPRPMALHWERENLGHLNAGGNGARGKEWMMGRRHGTEGRVLLWWLLFSL